MLLLPGELLKAEIKEQKFAANSLQEHRGSEHAHQWVNINSSRYFAKNLSSPVRDCDSWLWWLVKARNFFLVKVGKYKILYYLLFRCQDPASEYPTPNKEDSLPRPMVDLPFCCCFCSARAVNPSSTLQCGVLSHRWMTRNTLPVYQ